MSFLYDLSARSFFALGISIISLAVSIEVFSHKRKYPEKSYVIALLNTLLIPLRFFKIPPYDRKINLEDHLKSAVEFTKLNDFGDLGFVETYNSIFNSQLYKSFVPTNLGYFIAGMELDINFRRRLKLIDYFKRYPQISKTPIKSPLFVFGLGRSGTTFVHRLLSLDPNTHSPLLWELVNPTPNIALDSSIIDHLADREKRAQFIRDRLTIRHFLGDDGLEKYHEVGADLPEECLFALADDVPTIMSLIYVTLHDWERFYKETNGQKMLKAYAHYRKVVQLLAQQRGDLNGEKRWVFKSPLHILFLKELMTIFPDAKLVWAHRHPIPTVTSLASLLKALHGLYYEPASCIKDQLGHQTKSLAARFLKESSDLLVENKYPCSHVLYENLIQDPLQVVKNIYKDNDWEFTSEYEEILKDYLVKNAQQREEIKKKLSSQGNSEKRLHNHKPTDYHLTEDELSSGVFEDYILKYNIKSKN